MVTCRAGHGMLLCADTLLHASLVVSRNPHVSVRRIMNARLHGMTISAHMSSGVPIVMQECRTAPLPPPQ